MIIFPGFPPPVLHLLSSFLLYALYFLLSLFLSSCYSKNQVNWSSCSLSSIFGFEGAAINLHLLFKHFQCSLCLARCLCWPGRELQLMVDSSRTNLLQVPSILHHLPHLRLHQHSLTPNIFLGQGRHGGTRPTWCNQMPSINTTTIRFIRNKTTGLFLNVKCRSVCIYNHGILICTEQMLISSVCLCVCVSVHGAGDPHSAAPEAELPGQHHQLSALQPDSRTAERPAHCHPGR